MSPMTSRPLPIEIALLGYLRPGPQHGYQIHQRHNAPEGLGRIWFLKQAILYALLARLKDEGCVAASIQPQETRPARRMYRLTPKGLAVFQDWLAAPVERPRQMRQEFHVKLFFARQEGPAAVARLLDAQRQACRHWLAAHDAGAGQETAAHLWLVDRYRTGQIQAMLDWLDLCRVKLL